MKAFHVLDCFSMSVVGTNVFVSMRSPLISDVYCKKQATTAWKAAAICKENVEAT